ncbi:toll/interleukin-1 receptor domain-containing protein [Kibdelosporangium aridum]|uniref:Toll/interleukin-1 receptor domain-containing protein n=1 Tax=Kibdelosporangium aridum TaxID=2030 RepID=A0A428YJ69_KIBAR|nr:toll/interleukin-1 receptor domain-containing protein [Kibdelosporangium aridum]RSM67521.1 toll/interleukin-1 receptor domain-containing protein [Kibdelosporangium aridum]
MDASPWQPPGRTSESKAFHTHQIKKLPEETPNDERDVFISYSGEDRNAVAKPLAKMLKKAGVSVWMDTYELRIGDSLFEKINDGIRASRFGAIILSPAFFRGPWPLKELGACYAKQVEGQYILQIWHGVTKADILTRFPLLTDYVALRTGQYTIEEIATQIVAVVQPNSAYEAEEDEEDEKPSPA